MTAPNELGSQRRSRLRNSRLWILSAALGAATVYSVAATIHDTGREREAVRQVARAAAEQVASLASGRFELIALQTFAPVTAWAVPGPTTEGGQRAVDALARGQREGTQCRCRATIPVLEFFRWDMASGALDVATTAGQPAQAHAPPRSLLAELASDEAKAVRDRPRQSMHLLTDPRLGDLATVTIVQHDERFERAVVYGLVAPARESVGALFGRWWYEAPVMDSAFGLARLDSQSVQVTTARSATLFGVLGADRSYRATAHPRGPLEGLAVTVALAPGQIRYRLLISRARLWFNGALLMCTALVIAVAIGASRRELLLARARSDFVASVSHEFRMPLAQILLASETLTLRRERDDRERLALVTSIVRETRRLIALVENVLLFSRSGEVDLRPHLQPVSVRELFGDVVDAVRLAVEDAGQEIEVRVAPSMAILGDRTLVRQALVNLVDNALKYGTAGQRIRLASEQHPPTSVRLYVEDEGPGVPQSQRARVFEPYERLARDQTSERTGTGLGLAVVRHVAYACGGRVWLEEAPGGGTRAVLELRSADPGEPVLPPTESA